MAGNAKAVTVELPEPTGAQRAFVDDRHIRRVIRAGRRVGKTTGIAIFGVEQFLAGKRVLYATPTTDQLDHFWTTCVNALSDAIEAGLYSKNVTRHIIERVGTKQRIRGKTAWNADTLRGDWADVLILDEYQLMHEDTWGVVGVPMMLDSNGTAVFIYTPPSARTIGVSKAKDKRHAAKLYKQAEADTTGRWRTFHFTSYDNPHLDQDALSDITLDMSQLAYRQEILAEDIDEVPGALWKRDILDTYRADSAPSLVRIVVGVDPPAEGHKRAAECGIVVVGICENDNLWVIADHSKQGMPDVWGNATLTAYDAWQADRIIAEKNQGGAMVKSVLQLLAEKRGSGNFAYTGVSATRDKYIRAEPVSALYESGRVHHVGIFPELEDQMCSWVPGEKSPDRLDALVWACSHLALGKRRSAIAVV